MLNAGAPGFRITCRDCGTVLAVAGRWLQEVTLAKLIEHVQRKHECTSLAGDAQAGAILAHYDVTPTDAR